MGFMNGVWRLLGAAEDEHEQDQIVDYPARKSARHGAEEQQIIDMPGLKADSTMCIFQPLMEGDAPAFSMKEYAGCLLERKAVIVDVNALASTDLDEATRIVDYLSGVSEAVSGTVFEMAKNIFLFMPSNVALEGDELKKVEVY